MLTIALNNENLTFHTDPSLFSPGGLDPGTAAMLSCASVTNTDKVLDLGCGYGVVGIYLARLIGSEQVTLCDIDPIAIRLARQNSQINQVSGVRIIQSDGFNQIDDTGYTLILSNPPYHTDFSVAKHFIEKGFNRLALGGKMLMVTRRKKWYKEKFISVFGGVKIIEKDGYYVFIAEKRSRLYAAKTRGNK